MHPQSRPCTIDGTVLKGSDDLVILGVSFHSKMTFEKNLRSVSRVTSQRLDILRKSWRVFHDRSLLGRCFRCFVLPVLEYCSAVWWSAADTQHKLLDRAVSRARFLTGNVFECNILNHRSVAILCMSFKVMCNPVHPLNVALLGPLCRCGLYAVLWSHIGTLMHHLAAEPRCTAILLFPSQCPSGAILLNPYSMVWDWRVSIAGPVFFYWPKLLYLYFSFLLFFIFSSFCISVGIVGLGSLDW